MAQISAIKLSFPQRILAAQERFRLYTGALSKLRTQHPGLAQGGYAAVSSSSLPTLVLAEAISGNIACTPPLTDMGMSAPLMSFEKLKNLSDGIFAAAEGFCVQEKLDLLRDKGLEVDDLFEKRQSKKSDREKIAAYNRTIDAVNNMRGILLEAIGEYTPPPRHNPIREIFGQQITVDGVLSALKRLSVTEAVRSSKEAFISDIEKYLKSELPPLLDRSIHWLLSMVGMQYFADEKQLLDQYYNSLSRRRARAEIVEAISREISRVELYLPSDTSIVWKDNVLVCRNISFEYAKRIDLLNSVLAEGEAAGGDISFFNFPEMRTIDEIKTAIGGFLQKGYIHLLFAMESEKFAAALAEVPEILRQRREIEAALLGKEA